MYRDVQKKVMMMMVKEGLRRDEMKCEFGETKVIIESEPLNQGGKTLNNFNTETR